MAGIWISFALLASVQVAVSEFDESVCSILEESYGLIPPPVPVNFAMKSEVVEHQGGYSGYEEMYFDYANARAKYKRLLNTFEYNYLFDYDTEQVVEWIKVHPGTSIKRDPLSQSCEAVDMDESPVAHLFSYQQDGRARMLNSNQVLRYGGQYLYAANGTEILYERALQANKFVGCIFDKSNDATTLNTYHFADTSIVEPAGGTPSSVVTGSDEKPLSVPVKFHITGTRTVKDNNDKFVELVYINHTYSISWFKGEPQFEPETFQIPPWIHCNGYRGRKDIPKFPKAFSTRMTVSTFYVDELGQLQENTSFKSYEEIYYDSDKKLARRDFIPHPLIDTDIKNKFGSLTPVSTIYDFNEGLRYTINKPSGRCYITPIAEGEIFDTEEDLLFRKLATPEELFMMQMDDMQYKGKAFARDIECDVWNGQHFHKKYGFPFVKETYFSTDGWHALADGAEEYGVPVKHVLIKKDADGEVAEGILAYNFLKFQAQPPAIALFDIKNCVEHIDHKRFAIELALTSDSSDSLFKHRYLFLQAAQLFIANQTAVNTPLRVQRLYVRPLPSSDRTFLVFSLLEKAYMKDFPGYPESGKNLQDAIELLQKLVDDGKFYVQFRDPKIEKTVTILAESGSLYTLTASGSLTKSPLVPAKLITPKTDEADNTPKEKSTNVKEGMKTGNLVLLSFAMLFIGIGVGIAVMYLYIRIYSERFVEDKINLTPTPGTSGAGDSEDRPQETI